MPSYQEIKTHPGIHSCAWISSGQTDPTATINLPPSKGLGVTKIILNNPMDQNLKTFTRLQRPVPGADALPQKNQWANLRCAHTLHDYAWGGTTLANGANTYVDFSESRANTARYVGLDYVFSAGTPPGTNITPSFPSNGTVRFTIYNNTGSSYTFPAGTLHLRVMNSVDEFLSENAFVSADTLWQSQICEDGLPYPIAELYLKKLTDWIGGTKYTRKGYSDYFAGIYGYQVGQSCKNDMGYATSRLLLSTQAYARKYIAKISEVYQLVDSQYFAAVIDGKHPSEYRDKFFNGYLGGIFDQADGQRIYELIFNLQKMELADPGGDTLVYGWNSAEGIGNVIERMGVYYALPYTFTPQGTIYALWFGEFSFSLLENETFWTMVLAQDYVAWHDNGRQSPDIKLFSRGSYGGFAEWKTKFEDTQGNKNTYVPGNPNMPPYVEAGERFPGGPAPGLNGMHSGTEKFSRFQNRMNQSFVHATFDYTFRGTNKNGYPGGRVPKNGSLGNAEVSRRGFANYGQDNIVDLMENHTPPVFYFTGTEGDGFYFFNPRAGSSETTTYNVSNFRGNFTFNIVGPNPTVLLYQ